MSAIAAAWVRIEAVGSFYQDTASLAYIPPGELAIRSLRNPGRLRQSLGQSNDNITIALDNNAETIALYERPPVGKRLTLHRGAEATYTGTITQARVSADSINLTTES